MTAYVYVLWAVEDDLVKVGISRQLKKRLATHAGNSSNPVSFERWSLYQFGALADAQKIESLAIKHLTKQGFSYRGKKELFRCPPTAATSVIEKACHELNISPLKNFPFGLDELLETFGGFPCLPDCALESLDSEQRRLYWRGVKDALTCFSYLDGVKISQRDFLVLRSSMGGREEINSELWTTIIDHYRNDGPIDSNKDEKVAAQKVAWAALDKIKVARRLAYSDWQEIDYDDEAA